MSLFWPAVILVLVAIVLLFDLALYFISLNSDDDTGE